jgi:cell division transport system permease protein
LNSSTQNKSKQHGTPTRLLGTHRDDLLASWQRMWRTPLSTLMTITVIAVALLMPACLALVNANLQSMVSDFRGSARITLYLGSEVSADEGRSVSANLLERGEIVSADYVSSQDALAEFSSATGLGNILTTLPDNPLPAAIVITPELANPDAIAALAEELRKLPEVQTVQLDEAWIRRVDALASTVGLLARSLGLLIALGVCFIIGNTIRTTVESRRDEIRVIKLVGGTDSFIARPLLYTGLLQGAAGGLLAALLLALLSWIAGTALQGLNPPSAATAVAVVQLQGPGPEGMAILLAVGASLGWIAAFAASWRYVRAVSL